MISILQNIYDSLSDTQKLQVNSFSLNDKVILDYTGVSGYTTKELIIGKITEINQNDMEIKILYPKKERFHKILIQKKFVHLSQREKMSRIFKIKILNYFYSIRISLTMSGKQ